MKNSPFDLIAGIVGTLERVTGVGGGEWLNQVVERLEIKWIHTSLKELWL